MLTEVALAAGLFAGLVGLGTARAGCPAGCGSSKDSP
jgi:hypothetical protein